MQYPMDQAVTTSARPLSKTNGLELLEFYILSINYFWTIDSYKRDHGKGLLSISALYAVLPSLTERHTYYRKIMKMLLANSLSNMPILAILSS